MFNKAKPAQDAFSISLGGMTTITSFVAAPAIASDRLNADQDDRRERKSTGTSRFSRLRLWSRRAPEVAHEGCA